MLLTGLGFGFKCLLNSIIPTDGLCFAFLLEACISLYLPLQSTLEVFSAFCKAFQYCIPRLSHHASHRMFLFKPHRLCHLVVKRGSEEALKQPGSLCTAQPPAVSEGKCTGILVCHRNCTSLTNTKSKQQVVPRQSFGRLSSTGG